MRIVSGPVGRERVHYEAPPHGRLAAEVRDEYYAALEQTSSGPLDITPWLGGMTNKKYAHLTGASPATAQRDLAALVSNGYLVLRGAGRSARYELAS